MEISFISKSGSESLEEILSYMYGGISGEIISKAVGDDPSFCILISDSCGERYGF